MGEPLVDEYIVRMKAMLNEYSTPSLMETTQITNITNCQLNAIAARSRCHVRTVRRVLEKAANVNGSSVERVKEACQSMGLEIDKLIYEPRKKRSR